MKEFYGRVAEKMQEILGEDYKVEVVKTRKNNGLVLTGVNVQKQGIKANPTIYFEED